MSRREDAKDRDQPGEDPQDELRLPGARTSHVTPLPPENGSGKRDRFEVLAARRVAEAIAGRLEPPSPEEVLFAVLELNRSVNVEMKLEAIVHGYVEALRLLFPRRRFAVRLFSPEDDSALSLVYSTDPLAVDERERLTLSQEALDRHELSRTAVEARGVQVSGTYRALFEEPGSGLDIPLVARANLIGFLNVEYEPGLLEPTFDRSMIVPLAVQLGAALWNARLLRESNYLRDNLGKLLDHANAPIVVIGADRQLRVVNRAFVSLTGAERKEVLGRDFLQMVPESERGRILPVFIRALRGEPTSNFEMRLTRPEGGRARVLINTASIMSADGEVEGVIAIGRDMTELHELEEQVIQAEKLATLGQLAAGVVHELNNPLTSISVYAEYLLRKGQRAGTDSADLEKLRRIVESADRILKFTRDLVTYARPSTEKPAFIQIGDILDQSLMFCEHVIGETHAEVVRDYGHPDASVYAVKGQLHQVFINLITNACHAMPSDGAVLHLETRLEENEMLRIRVSDNGCGIPEAQQRKIFEPFFTTKGEGKGTGLGLSIVRNIVEQHGGTIEVQIAESGGAVFEIRLPGRLGSSE